MTSMTLKINAEIPSSSTHQKSVEGAPFSGGAPFQQDASPDSFAQPDKIREWIRTAPWHEIDEVAIYRLSSSTSKLPILSEEVVKNSYCAIQALALGAGGMLPAECL